MFKPMDSDIILICVRLFSCACFRARATCSCRSCNAGNVWKLTRKNLYSHVAVLALLAGHGTLRVTAATATCNCK